jgi:DNA-binding LytR/AlgR family response regulator
MNMRINSDENINPSEIIVLKSKINYTWIFLPNKKVLSSHTLKRVAQKLDKTTFIEINRGIMINKNQVKYFNNDKHNPFVTLSNNETHLISRRKFNNVCLGLI